MPENRDPIKYPIYINDPKRLFSESLIPHSFSKIGNTIEIAYVSPPSHIPIKPTIIKT